MFMMAIRDLIEKVYQSIMKRIFRWVLPLLLVLSYLTAYGIKKVTLFNHIKRIELVTLHYLSGIAITLVLIVIIYHFGYTSLAKAKIKESKTKVFSIFNYNKKITPEFLVEFLFYLSLTLTCTIGLLLFYSKYTYLGKYLSKSSTMIILHQLLGWSFLSIIFLKYYLVIVKWYENIIRYLREF